MYILQYLVLKKPKDRQEARMWALHLCRYCDETPDEERIKKGIDDYFAGKQPIQPGKSVAASANKPRPSKSFLD